MIKLFIADDRPVFHEGVKGIVAGIRDITLVDGGSGKPFLDAARAAAADVLLLGDVSVPTPQILDLIREHRRTGSKLKILVIATHLGDEHAVREQVSSESRPREALSDREYEVLCMFCQAMADTLERIHRRRYSDRRQYSTPYLPVEN